MALDTGSSLQATVRRDAGNLFTSASFSNFTAFGVNKWMFCVGRVDITGVDADQQVFIGDLNRTPAEPSSYVLQLVGSGTAGDNSGDDQFVGNNQTAAVNFDGQIAWGGIWDRYLSLAEIFDQWDHPHQTPGNVLFTHYGLDGDGIQIDRSGFSNHGTVTGATLAQGPPLIGRRQPRLWAPPRPFIRRTIHSKPARW